MGYNSKQLKVQYHTKDAPNPKPNPYKGDKEVNPLVNKSYIDPTGNGMRDPKIKALAQQFGVPITIPGQSMGTNGYGNDMPLKVTPNYADGSQGPEYTKYPNTGNHSFPGAVSFTERSMASGGQTNSDIARAILEDGMVYGHSLSDSQREHMAEQAGLVIDEDGNIVEAEDADDSEMEYARRGGQKRKRKKTSSNPVTGINDLMVRNETIYGQSGKKRFVPKLEQGGWLDKYQPGGVTLPKNDATHYYTSDINDPRFQAQKDSSNVYIGGLLDFVNTVKSKTYAEKDKFINDNKFFDSYFRLNKLNGADPKPSSTYIKTFPDFSGRGTWHTNQYEAQLYDNMKPTQQVIYQPKPAVKPTAATPVKENKWGNMPYENTSYLLPESKPATVAKPTQKPAVIKRGNVKYQTSGGGKNYYNVNGSWVSQEDYNNSKSTEINRTTGMPIKQMGGMQKFQPGGDFSDYRNETGPIEPTAKYMHFVDDTKTPENLSESAAYRLSTYGRGPSYAPITGAFNKESFGTQESPNVRYDNKTGFNYQINPENNKPFKALDINDNKNLKRYVINPYQGQQQTYDTQIKKDGSISDVFSTTSDPYKQQQNIFGDLYSQNLYKFKGDKNAAYSATVDLMQNKIEPQFKGDYYNFINDPNTSYEEKFILDQNQSGLNLNKETINGNLQGVQERRLFKELNLTYPDLDKNTFEKKFAAEYDKRKKEGYYKEEEDKYNKLYEDWANTTGIPKKQMGGWLDQYQPGGPVWQDEGSKNLKLEIPKTGVIDRSLMDKVSNPSETTQSQSLLNKYAAAEQNKAAVKTAIEGRAETAYNKNLQRQELKKKYPTKNQEEIQRIQDKIESPLFYEPAGQLASYATRFHGLTDDEIASITGSGTMGDRLGVAANMGAWALGNEIGGKAIGNFVSNTSPYIKQGLNAIGKPIEKGINTTVNKLLKYLPGKDKAAVNFKPQVFDIPPPPSYEQYASSNLDPVTREMYERFNGLGRGNNASYTVPDINSPSSWANNYDEISPNIFTSNIRKPVNKSGLTKEEVLSKASTKDKEALSNMSELEFQETVIKPTGEVVPYKQGPQVTQMGYNSDIRGMQLKNAVPMTPLEYSNAFNEKIDLLNDIIVQKNKSGVQYKVKGLDPTGNLMFETPEQFILDANKPVPKHYLEALNKIDDTGFLYKGYNDKLYFSNMSGSPGFTTKEEAKKWITDIIEKESGKRIPKGENTWHTNINPGEWRGEVEDIANAEYYKSIPGLNMSGTSNGVFSDRVPRRGSGTYEAINEYLKRLDLGRVKPGFNSQTEFSKGLWENAINKGKAFGFYNNPHTVYGAMKSVAPYVVPTAIGAAALNEKKQGGQNGWLNKYQTAGQVPKIDPSLMGTPNFASETIRIPESLKEDPFVKAKRIADYNNKKNAEKKALAEKYYNERKNQKMIGVKGTPEELDKINKDVAVYSASNAVDNSRIPLSERVGDFATDMALNLVGSGAYTSLGKGVSALAKEEQIASGLSKFIPKKLPGSPNAPKGNMYGENQVLTQQSRLLDPKIKAKFFEHQAPEIEAKIHSNILGQKMWKQPKDYGNRITPENYDEFVKNIHGSTEYDLAANSGRSSNTLGLGDYGKPGMVYSDAPLNNLGKDIVNAHEKNHGMFVGTLSKEMSKDLLKPFGTNKPVPFYGAKAQPDEVLARMAQFKNAVGIGDNQSFTLGHLNLIRKNYANSFLDNGITEMLNKIKPGSSGEKEFLKNMNKYAFGIGTPVAIGAAALNQKKLGGQSNWLNKYQVAGPVTTTNPKKKLGYDTKKPNTVVEPTITPVPTNQTGAVDASGNVSQVKVTGPVGAVGTTVDKTKEKKINTNINKNYQEFVKKMDSGDSKKVKPITTSPEEDKGMLSFIGKNILKGATLIDTAPILFKKEIDKAINDWDNTISDAYTIAENGLHRKLKTYFGIGGEDDDVITKPVEEVIPKTLKEYYGNKTGAQITNVIPVKDRNGKETNRQFKQEVLPVSEMTFGFRNKGDLTPIKTEGIEVTTFNPFKKGPLNIAGKALPETTTVIALDEKGKLHTGQYKDFKQNKDWYFTPTFQNNITEITEDLIQSKKNPAYKSPVIKVLNDKGKLVNGSMNILVENAKSGDYYGSVQGGRVILVNPDTKEQILVSGSLNHIKKEFKKFKGDSKYVEAYTLDNGSYSRGLSTKNGILDSKQLKAYDLENQGPIDGSGGNGLYIIEYNQPISKFREDYVETPNIRTKNDESFKKGHKLKNELKNVILHHTAYTNPATSEAEVGKQYATKGANTSHVVIQENGKRTVYASPEQVTFHAGESLLNGKENVNDFSIGVEFQGSTSDVTDEKTGKVTYKGKALTQPQIESFVEYYAPIAKKYNIKLKDIVTHQMIRDNYINAHNKDTKVKTKPDITQAEYKRILKYMKDMGYK